MKSGALTLIILLALTTGCSTIERLSGRERLEEEPPVKLTDIDASVTVTRNWSYDVGAGSAQQGLELVPGIQGETLYAASPNGNVSAVDLNTGKRVWRTAIPHLISGAVGVGGDVILAGTPDGLVVALDAKNGQELWNRQLSSEILAPPASNSGVAVVRTIDGHVYGLSSLDGEQRWVFHREVPTLTLRGNSAPLVARGAVLVGFASGKVVAADLATGRVLWDISVGQSRGRNEVDRMVDIDATPVLVGSVLYVSAFQGAVTALALGSRKVLWSEEISSHTHMSADNDNIYVSDTEGKVLALDRLTGQVVWEQAEMLRRRLSGPTSVGKYLVVTDYAGVLHVLRKSDGKIVGRRSFGGGRLTGVPVVRKGTIYSMTQNGDLVSVSLNEGS